MDDFLCGLDLASTCSDFTERIWSTPPFLHLPPLEENNVICGKNVRLTAAPSWDPPLHCCHIGWWDVAFIGRPSGSEWLRLAHPFREELIWASIWQWSLPTMMTSDVYVVAWIRLLPAGTRAWPTGTSFKHCPDHKGSLQIHEVRKTTRQGICQFHRQK